MQSYIGMHNVHKLCRKQPKVSVLAIFLSFVHWIDFKLHISIILNDLDTWAVISPKLDHSKITQIPFWMIQNAKKGGFDHFLELVLLDRLDTAYYESTICFTTFVSVIRSKKSYALRAPPLQI